MDEQKRDEIEKKLRKQRYILASVQATITKLEAQLATGVTRSSRNKPKGAKNDKKVTENDSKMTKNAPKDETKKDDKKGFFETIF